MILAGMRGLAEASRTQICAAKRIARCLADDVGGYQCIHLSGRVAIENRQDGIAPCPGQEPIIGAIPVHPDETWPAARATIKR